MFRITLIALGNKMPGWVIEASEEYEKRLREHAQLSIIDIPLAKQVAQPDVVMQKEAQKIALSIPKGAYVVALDVTGASFTSVELSKKMEHLQHHPRGLCLIIGGPHGLAQEVLQNANERWSLSKLTLPHTLARVVVLETLFRAFSILSNHPYHK